MKTTFLLIFCFLTLAVTAQENPIKWPEITKESKPWTRLWWPGSIGTEKDITVALEKYRDVGLGGTELTVLYGVRGQE